MLFSILSSNTPAIFGVLTLLLVLLAISIHEFSHALAATVLGDSTAKYNGRLTLNPLAHFDVFGLLALLLTRFGWGKPVPINPSNFKEPLRDSAIVSFAGPLSNFILAGVLILLIKLSSTFISGLSLAYTISSLTQAAIISMILGIFNLLPLFPLDGEKILRFVLPDSIKYQVGDFLSKWSLFLLFGILLPILPGGNSILGIIISPVVSVLVELISKIAY